MTAQRISWKAAESGEGVTKTFVESADTQYGTYTVLGSVVVSTTSYTDATGTATKWYRIRHTDGTYYSDYSEPFTNESRVNLCTVPNIKKVIDTSGRWTDDHIFDIITDETANIYYECGRPISAIWSEIGKIDNTNQELYYVGEPDIYRVDRIFYGTTSKTELTLEDAYSVNEKHGMVKLLTTGVGAITLDTDKDIEIHYVPNLFHRWVIYRVAERLLEEIDLTQSGKTSKELTTIINKKEKVEMLISQRVGLQLSSDLKYYDSTYGINMKHLSQNHDKNRYLASTGDSNW